MFDRGGSVDVQLDEAELVQYVCAFRCGRWFGERAAEVGDGRICRPARCRPTSRFAENWRHERVMGRLNEQEMGGSLLRLGSGLG